MGRVLAQAASPTQRCLIPEPPPQHPENNSWWSCASCSPGLATTFGGISMSSLSQPSWPALFPQQCPCSLGSLMDQQGWVVLRCWLLFPHHVFTSGGLSTFQGNLVTAFVGLWPGVHPMAHPQLCVPFPLSGPVLRLVGSDCASHRTGTVSCQAAPRH